jgi:hypothetical protein
MNKNLIISFLVGVIITLLVVNYLPKFDIKIEMAKKTEPVKIDETQKNDIFLNETTEIVNNKISNDKKIEENNPKLNFKKEKVPQVDSENVAEANNDKKQSNINEGLEGDKNLIFKNNNSDLIRIKNNNSDLIRIKTVAPKYLSNNQKHCVEAWVLLNFTVSSTGEVINPKVIDFEPGNETKWVMSALLPFLGNPFARNAIRAIKQWRYEPRIEDGKAVSTENVKHLIRWELDENYKKNECTEENKRNNQFLNGKDNIFLKDLRKPNY